MHFPKNFKVAATWLGIVNSLNIQNKPGYIMEYYTMIYVGNSMQSYYTFL